MTSGGGEGTFLENMATDIGHILYHSITSLMRIGGFSERRAIFFYDERDN